ncbi:MAG: hypothetical protein Q4B50_03565 [Bacillota bacterium]|nr:hypothetical protein [Bacillota bacterium]
MVQFFNQATLSYDGRTTSSNVTVGELVEVLSATKTSLPSSYRANDRITYIISIVNSGSSAFTELQLNDNLGAYSFGESQTLTPLTYYPDSVLYYINGVLQPTPTVTADSDLEIGPFSIPASSNALIIYQATVNQFAPVGVAGSITNEATISGSSLSTPVTVENSINVEEGAFLTISKAISPTSVPENGQVSYTFIIQNAGNTAVTAEQDASVSDTFDPLLNPITVTFNGLAWVEDTNYSYDASLGQFATIPGQITVPAATYSQDPDTGSWSVVPGFSTLVVTGTI